MSEPVKLYNRYDEHRPGRYLLTDDDGGRAIIISTSLRKALASAVRWAKYQPCHKNRRYVGVYVTEIDVDGKWINDRYAEALVHPQER